MKFVYLPEFKLGAGAVAAEFWCLNFFKWLNSLENIIL
jgi:hypothetical protein